MIFAILWLSVIPIVAAFFVMTWILVQMLRLSWLGLVLIVGGAAMLVRKIAGALRARR